MNQNADLEVGLSHSVCYSSLIPRTDAQMACISNACIQSMILNTSVCFIFTDAKKILQCMLFLPCIFKEIKTKQKNILFFF